ncbi:M23 family metallopeptidase [Homoserinimonas aerilata]|uniref:M23 family metallopeptidase n=1 Tax=Homoserinimonas aerilata TaxID=1162970 RepID=UPI001C894372|nr:M23 family metallopeptidase [Homoserinimonas aerilata]
MPQNAVHQNRGDTLPSLPPALQRRIGYVHGVKRLRPRFALVTGAFVLATGLGAALPAAAQTIEGVVGEPQVPSQSLVIASVPDIAPLAPDSYTATLLPTLVYPVAPGIGIASGYGPRSCSGCHSTFHEGIDIFPGAGTPIQSIAAGTVREASTSGDFGVHLVIDHVIDGQLVTAVYAHLQAGSMNLSAGQQLEAGQVIGAVGATGNAQGAHLHFELHPGGGASVNPYAWIAARIG